MDVRQTSLYCRAARRRRSERGVGMISTLAVVVILGVIVTIVISNGGTPSTPQTNVSGAPSGTTTTTGPSSIGSDAKAAAISSCLGNFAIVESAISDYQTLENSTPPAGTTWATSPSSGPILQSWPSDPPYYALSWNGHELSVIPWRGGAASHGNTGTSSPPTGCHAV
jgi:hypothetical protein